MANKADQISLAGNKEVLDLNRFMIEELPDEILTIIISFLSLKEAVRTSILSNRWRTQYLFMSRLNFDADTLILSARSKIDISSREEHVKSVCKLLQHYLDSKVKYVRLSVPTYYRRKFWWYMDQMPKEMLKDYEIDDTDVDDRWIRSAILMGAEELKLIDFSPFSFEMLSGSKLKHLHLLDCSIPPPGIVKPGDHLHYSLATLELEDLWLYKTVLESIFSTCVNLWKLVLRHCRFSRRCNLTIAGPGISNLKCLQIFSLSCLDKLQVFSAANLTYFEYRSDNPDTQLSFSNVPKLEEMLLDTQIGNQIHVDDMFTDFAIDAPQLKRLMSLHTTLNLNLDPQIPVTSTILCQLEQLELILDIEDCNLFKMIPILVACPSLQKFHLIAYDQPTNVLDMPYPSSKHPFPNLKQVQIRIFYGTSSEIPFVFYMLENAVALEPDDS